MKLKKIGVLSAGYAGAVLAFVSIILELIALIIAVNVPALQSQADSSILTALSGNPVIFGIISVISAMVGGFVGGLVLALVYNYIVVKITGGILLELEK